MVGEFGGELFRILKHIAGDLPVGAGQLCVVHDSVNALEGATAGQTGLIVIAGTGSVVSRGRNSQGRDLRVGGWGHLFGDEGSAYWIGREAVRALLGAFDQTGEAKQLTPMFFKRLHVSSAYELKDMYYSGCFTRDHLAGLSIWVNEAAEAGDFVVRHILCSAGEELARLALAILSLLFAPADPSGGPLLPSEGLLVCY